MLIDLRFLTAGAIIFAAGSALAGCKSAATSGTLGAVPRSALCFTEGAPARADERGIRLEAGGVRAVIAGDRGGGNDRSAEIAFRYRGPSAFDAPLANGELRRQIGLKLRAQDTCNVVYVMWHVAPKPGVAVSVKRNAGRSTHAACGDGGYVNLTSEPGLARAPLVTPDAPDDTNAGTPRLPHVLRADLDGHTLRVTADGIVVWRGELPPAAFEFDGPAGLRTDNGTFDVELRVPNGGAAGSASAACEDRHGN